MNSYGDVHYDYDYPEGLDLRPGSKIHQKIMSFVMTRARESRNAMSVKFDTWNELDRTLQAYISPELEEKMADAEEDDYDRFSEKSDMIVIPISYAILETLMTYLIAAFLVEPYFKYEGVEPSDIPKVAMLESVVSYQMRKRKSATNLMTMWRDALVYGFGGNHVGWTVEKGYRTVKKESSIWSDLRGMFIKGKPIQQRDVVTTYEGNQLENIDPYMCLPDPNFPIEDVQDSEFFGWIERTNLMSILEEERYDDSLFNVKYLKGSQKATSILFTEAQGEKLGYQSYASSGIGNVAKESTRPVDVIYMYCKIIPEEFELGTGEYPETWIFAVAGDKYIVKAQPVDADHNMIPVAITAPESDGHNILPVSKMEIIYPVQNASDWYIQSRVANVRKTLNDMLVVDPQLINMKDMRDPRPGKLIRMRRSAWGRGVKDAVMQLNVTDVTQSHIGDIEFLSSMAKQLSGAVDSIQGIRRRTSERVSATEASDVRSSALSRLEKMAKIIAIQAHSDIAFMLAANTRQYMSDEVYVKIIGDYALSVLQEYGISNSEEKIKVSPADIDVNFDVIPHDGTIPGSGNPNVWLQLFQMISGNPALAQTFDTVRIFEHLARLLGAKNIGAFINNPNAIKVMSDENVKKETQKGNIVPFKGGM